MSLSKQASLCRVAILVESRHVYTQEILRGIVRYGEERRHWSIRDMSPTVPQRLSGTLREWKADGVLAWIDDRRMAKAILRLGVPAVDVCRSLGDAGFPTVGPDEHAMARLAATHLMDQRVQHFGVVAVEQDDNSSADMRARHFREIVLDAGFSCDVFHLSCRGGMAKDAWAAKQDQLAQWIGSLPKPLGLMACDDQRAVYAVDACRCVGAAIPDDVAVVGMGNDDCLCSLSSPSISSVDLNPQRIGYEAARLLDRLMADASADGQDVLVEPRGLVARASTDMLAGRDSIIAEAVKFIQHSACNHIQVSDVARHVGLSNTALASRLKQVLGRTIHQEIRRVQVERVKHLLLTTDAPLKQIAAQTGFYHVEYLMRVFRQTTGETLSQYRERMR